MFSCIQYVLVSPTSKDGSTTVHEQLSRHLPTLLRPDYADFLTVNKLMRHSDFFFQVMAKSMAQYLLTSGRIKVKQIRLSISSDLYVCPHLTMSYLCLKMVRNERFSDNYQRKIEELLDALFPYFQKYKEIPIETKQLNMSLAHFLKVCFTECFCML